MDRVGSPRATQRLLPIVLAGLTAGSALSLLFASISGTGDTPCGGPLARNFDWLSFNQCGIAYTGATGAAAILFLVALVLAELAWRRPDALNTAIRPLVGLVMVGAGWFLALTWKAATYPDPVLVRGWVAVRDLTAYATVSLMALTGLLKFVATRTRPARPAPNVPR